MIESLEAEWTVFLRVSVKFLERTFVLPFPIIPRFVDMPAQGIQFREAPSANALKGFVTGRFGMLLQLAAIRKHSAAAILSAGVCLIKAFLTVGDVCKRVPFGCCDVIIQFSFARPHIAAFAMVGFMFG